MLKVTIIKPEGRVQPYTNKRTGQPATLTFQEAWVHTCDENGKPGPFPEKTEFIVPKDAHGTPTPYAPGEYQLHPSAVFVDRDGRLAAQMRLTPLKRPA